DFREKKLFDLAALKIKKVTVNGMGQEVHSDRDAQGNFKFAKAHVRKEAHSLTVALTNAIENARAKTFVGDDKKKEAEGKLSPPDWTITFEGEGIASTKLEIGQPNPDKSRTVRVSDGTLAILEEDLSAKAKSVLDAYDALVDISTDKANAVKVTHGKDVI